MTPEQLKALGAPGCECDAIRKLVEQRDSLLRLKVEREAEIKEVDA